ncbi:MAG: FAD-binding oxidoreductase [Pseudomonadota bacterium]
MTDTITPADCVVIGAGITGMAAAAALAEAGASVIVVERYAPAAMASGWTLAGVRQSGRHPAELPLVTAALETWQTLDERSGIATEYRRDGNLRLARTETEIATIRALVADQSRAGLDLRFLDDRSDIRALAPGLSDRVLAASFCPTDGHANPAATVTAFRTLAERNGARILTGTAVHSVEITGGRFTALETAGGRIAAGTCIIAAGIQVNALLEPLGLEIPLRRPMVTVVQSVPLPPLLAPVLGVANADMAARQQADGRLRVTSGAGTWDGTLVEEDGSPAVHPPAMAVADTVRTVANVLPAMADAPVARVWAGLLDLTPDALPVLDQAPGIDNLILGGGFSGHGFGIAPASGSVLCDLALGRVPRFDIQPFTFERFAGVAADAPLTLHG